MLLRTETLYSTFARHTEIVAFLASLCKVLSVFKTGTIPPAANLHTLNPAIEWERYKLHAPTRATPLPCRSGTISLVSIASSGIGGSNGHVVLEGPPIVPVPDRSVISSSGPALLMACGLSSRSAASIGQSLQGLLSAGTADLHALSTVLGRRAKQMSWRSYAVVEEGSLNAVSFSAPQHCPRTKPPILFLFSGQGPQHVDSALFHHTTNVAGKSDAVLQWVASSSTSFLSSGRAFLIWTLFSRGSRASPLSRITVSSQGRPLLWTGPGRYL